MLSATLNESIPLTVLASDGRTDLYGRVHLYDQNGAFVTTLTLSHVARGLYSAQWTPVAEGYYNVVTQLFYDPECTVDAGYGVGGETIEVSSTKTNILRLLGLHHDNSVLDQQQYNADGNLVSARLRSYATREHALLAGEGGLLFMYQISSEYIADALVKYSVTRTK